MTLDKKDNILYVGNSIQSNGMRYDISIFEVDAGTGNLTYKSTVNNSGPEIIIDSNANFAITYMDDGSQGTVSLYEVDKNTPSLSLLDSQSINSNSHLHKNDIHILEEKSGNFAPVVTVSSGELRYFDGNEFQTAFKDYITAGQQNVFSAALSYDPDAAQCNANPDNYVYDIQLVSKPAGSSLTQADIEIRDTLPSPPYAPLFFYTKGKWGEFNPDVPGEYVFDFSMTDDPGTCEGVAQKTTKQIVFTAKTGFQQTAPEYIFLNQDPPPPPAPGMVLQYDWSFYEDYPPGSGQQYSGSPRKNQYYQVWMDSYFHACPTFICAPSSDTYILPCISTKLDSYQEAVDYCHGHLPAEYTKWWGWEGRYHTIESVIIYNKIQYSGWN